MQTAQSGSESPRDWNPQPSSCAPVHVRSHIRVTETNLFIMSVKRCWSIFSYLINNTSCCGFSAPTVFYEMSIYTFLSREVGHCHSVQRRSVIRRVYIIKCRKTDKTIEGRENEGVAQSKHRFISHVLFLVLTP